MAAGGTGATGVAVTGSGTAAPSRRARRSARFWRRLKESSAITARMPSGFWAIWMAPRPKRRLGSQTDLVPFQARNVGTQLGQWKPPERMDGKMAPVSPAMMAPAGRRTPHSTTVASHTQAEIGGVAGVGGVLVVGDEQDAAQAGEGGGDGEERQLHQGRGNPEVDAAGSEERTASSLDRKRTAAGSV